IEDRIAPGQPHGRPSPFTIRRYVDRRELARTEDHRGTQSRACQPTMASCALRGGHKPRRIARWCTWRWLWLRQHSIQRLRWQLLKIRRQCASQFHQRQDPQVLLDRRILLVLGKQRRGNRFLALSRRLLRQKGGLAFHSIDECRSGSARFWRHFGLL